MKLILCSVFISITLGCIQIAKIQKRPHIIFIYADDLGWGDVSMHGSPEIPTPNVDALAMNGILLNNYYAQWLCTPSRAALLSGRYPIRLGLQHFVMLIGQQGGLPLDVPTLPQYLKGLGYKNHIVGKWHLGYMTKDYFPTNRGFDSFYGYLNGVIDYYDYTAYSETFLPVNEKYHGFDFYNGTNLIKQVRGEFLIDHLTNKAKEIIQKHDPDEPLFLYLSQIAVHGGNQYKPYDAPPKYVERVKYIPNVKRRIHAGRMVALDDSVGEVFRILDDKGMLENSIVLFVSDNGGDAVSNFNKHGSNFPLRGSKHTLFEGGMRVPALIWSPLLKQQSLIYNGMMSVVDWLPTLYKAAGGNPEILGDIDGIDMWGVLNNNLPSPRREVLYNIDTVTGASALRVGDLKVINGTSIDYFSWYNKPTYNCYNTVPQSQNCNFKVESTVRNILMRKGKWNVGNTAKWRKKASIACSQHPPEKNKYDCIPTEKPCLFNITEDPCEYHNLADEYPEIVNSMMNTIYKYKEETVESQFQPSDPRSNPLCHNFSCVPWLEPEFYTECTAYEPYELYE